MAKKGFLKSKIVIGKINPKNQEKKEIEETKQKLEKEVDGKVVEETKSPELLEKKPTTKEILKEVKQKIKSKKLIKEIVPKIEREYVIPLRRRFLHVPSYKKTPKAVKTIKEFLVRHMKIYDRDLKKIKIDKYLNEALWSRGIKNPPHKIKVKAIKEGEIVRVELVEFSDKLKFKKLRNEKIEKQSTEAKEKKRSLMQKAKESLKPSEKSEDKKKESLKPSEKSEDKNNDGVDDKKEVKEKQESVKEAGAKLEKQMAKKTKHSSGGKIKQKTQPVRKALAK